MDRVIHMFATLRKKYYRTIFTYLALNISIFLLTASLITFNLYSVRRNPTSKISTKWIYVSISIMSGITTFVSSLNSLFVYKRRYYIYSNHCTKIKDEISSYKLKQGNYENKDTRDVNLINRVSKILAR